MSTCRSCGAKIDWVELKSGKKMPVDPEPVSPDEIDEGMVLVLEDGTVINGRTTVIDSDIVGYVSHFSTCPQADEWRKSK